MSQTRLASLYTLALCALVLLAGCASSPPPADWQMNAASALESYEQRWLEGNSRAAAASLDRARSEIARTGQTDLAARAELIACATRVASLDFSPCIAYQRHALDAREEDASYARFLGGDWDQLTPAHLPSHYAALLKARDDNARNLAARDIAAPLPRLIAAALLLKRGQLAPQTLDLAIRTSTERGWRRPLLAWLEIQRQRAVAAGDTSASAQLRRRIELIQGAQADTLSASPGEP